MQFKPSEKLTKAVVLNQKKSPFFSHIVMNMKRVEDKDLHMKTMAVNPRGDMLFHPEFVEKCSIQELMGVVTHEALHLILMHLTRRGNRDHQLWNMAIDLKCNDILVDNEYDLPLKNKGALVPHRHKFNQFGIDIEDIDKKTAEEIYAELYQQIPPQQRRVLVYGNKPNNGGGDNKQDSSGNGQQPQSFDQHQEEQGMSKKDQKETEDKWKEVAVSALTIAKQQGNLPAGMQRMIDDLVNPKFNWNQLLYRYITSYIPYDTNWQRFSRRSYVTGIPQPRTVKENVDIVVGVDTSGSIGQEELRDFVSEIINIAKSIENINITLLPVDAEVQAVYPVSNGNIKKIQELDMKGGGGTDMTKIFSWAEENKPDCRCIVVLTDGFTPFPNNPQCDSIWVVSENGKIEEKIPRARIVNM